MFLIQLEKVFQVLMTKHKEYGILFQKLFQVSSIVISKKTLKKNFLSQKLLENQDWKKDLKRFLNSVFFWNIWEKFYFTILDSKGKLNVVNQRFPFNIIPFS